MVWFGVDDGFSTNPKVLSIPRSERLGVLGLWTLAGSWCCKHLTDGAVPRFMLDEWGAAEEQADRLCEVGLWRKTSKGYSFVNWDEYQPTKADVEEKRRKERERKDRYRKERAGQAGDSPRGVPAGVPVGQDAGRAAESGSPIPTHPNPIKRTSSPGGDAAFDEFWSAYPRKVGKDAARRAFAKAAKRVGPQLVVDGVKRFATDPNLPEKEFIPHPSTWLNAGRWEDEPLPGSAVAPVVDERVPLTDEQREWLSSRGISHEEFLERKDEPGWFESVKRIKPKEVAHA